jgi:hypothetical protein
VAKKYSDTVSMAACVLIFGRINWSFLLGMRRPFPLLTNAEAGVIINSLRSSLDILAVALAEQNGHVASEDVYFPIANNVLDLIDPCTALLKK